LRNVQLLSLTSIPSIHFLFSFYLVSIVDLLLARLSFVDPFRPDDFSSVFDGPPSVSFHTLSSLSVSSISPHVTVGDSFLNVLVNFACNFDGNKDKYAVAGDLPTRMILSSAAHGHSPEISSSNQFFHARSGSKHAQPLCESKIKQGR
jgi:hypothetical protein